VLKIFWVASSANSASASNFLMPQRLSARRVFHVKRNFRP
jgi:hypothetical protein